MTDLAPEYIAARRTLLDVYEALLDHHDSFIHIGSQAIYHHTGDVELNVPEFTTDADLAINTVGLLSEPEIGDVLRKAGFLPGPPGCPDPGHWCNDAGVYVDLMVASNQAGTMKSSARAARIAPHEKMTARIARGVEPALIDNEIATISALETGDNRSLRIRVASPAALLVAKAIKLSERMERADTQPSRLKEKDALDGFRILQAIETDELVVGFAKHRTDESAAAVSTEAIEVLRAHASTPEGRITQLATSAAQGETTVAPAFAHLTQELLSALGTRGLLSPL